MDVRQGAVMSAASAGEAGPRVLAGMTLLLLGGALAGCVEQFPDAQVGRGDVRNAIARGQLTSPKAATVALVSLEGAPAPVEAQFRQALTGEAAAREIAVTDAASARYLVRGYLAAYAGEGGGVQVAYTYDVFDAASRRREQRLSDTIEVPGAGGDPWAAVGGAVLTSLAGRSADDLAVGLAGTPEAQAAAGKVASAAPATAPTP